MREPVENDSNQIIGDTRLESRVETTLRPKLGSINERYAVGSLLGQGGMAVVYAATDPATGRKVALKQFTLPKEDRHYEESASLFEHEFLTLAQLSHPRIIEVYDYSVADTGPYYTMELLDGGDLRERTPMPWREACHLIYDVCSSLALIHSRRLVHRDISPRNIRCSKDGLAKLIDFGALVPMGPGDLIVGTPQFVAPEVVYRTALDARTDLFSLGATLYYTLTGRVPYSVKTFHDLLDAWEIKPQPPSFITPGIPAALDTLILSLISIDPASRPHSAFEVMQRLAAIAGLPRAEPESVSQAYLSTPTMVGREGLMAMIAHEAARAVGGRGRGVLIQGAAGLGRSRLLDATALSAKALGSTVLRAYGAASGEGFTVARSLIERLLDAAPDAVLAAARAEHVTDLLFESGPAPALEELPSKPKLKEFAASGLSRVDLQSALGRLVIAVTRRTPLVIAVDDLHLVDEPSLALLAALASQAERQRLLIVATIENDADPTDRTALAVFRRNSTRLALSRLERGDVERLFMSVFGDVPNVRFLSDRIDGIALGNPRTAMDLAQHLVDKGFVRYESGGWTLPGELAPTDLPSTAEGALRERISALPERSRVLAQAHALAMHHAFTRDEYAHVCPNAPALEIDRAIGDLVTAQLVVSDGRVYTIANQGVRNVLRSSMDAAALVERHQALVELYAAEQIPFGVVRHALLGGLDERGLDELSGLLAGAPERSALTEIVDIDPTEMAATFEQALFAAERLGEADPEITELRRWLVSLAIVADHAYFARTAPIWLARLKVDSGYEDWKAHPEIAEPADRLSSAMQLAYARYMATPEAERVYRPDEAITGLVRYVALGIAIGSNRLDTALVETLPDLLEPFAPINELVHIVWQNALATQEIVCRVHPERGRELWIEVYERLANVTGSDAQYATLIRNAVAFGVGTCEAWMGMESATEWAERLDGDPLQRVSALQLRRTVRMQLGDWEGAERLRKEAEVLALQTRSRQMFTNVTQVEVNACALAGDLTGLKQCIDRVKALAEQAPGWVPSLRLAEGRFQILCGNLEAGLESAESALAQLETPAGPAYPLASAWCGAVATRVEALIGLERYPEAKEVAERALSACAKLEIGAPAHDISRALALVEARLGDHEGAAARLATLIANQRELGISGLRLGATYETRARVAIAANDTAGTDEYMRLTAREYRYGHGSALGARYERLQQEAQQASGARVPSLAEFESGYGSGPTSATVVVTQAMKGAGGATERAGRALDLLCDERAATVGHLYLFKERGLKLAASRGVRTPPKHFDEFIRDFLDRELAECDAATRIFDDAASDQVVDTHFTDARGHHYYPFLLKGAVGNEIRFTGVVALMLPERPEPPDENLVVAVSTHFIQSGDTRGVEYGAWKPPRSD